MSQFSKQICQGTILEFFRLCNERQIETVGLSNEYVAQKFWWLWNVTPRKARNHCETLITRHDVNEYPLLFIHHASKRDKFDVHLDTW